MISAGGGIYPRSAKEITLSPEAQAAIGFDKAKLDDPVGALDVHPANGILGPLALGLFDDNQIATDIAALPTGLTAGAPFLAQLKGVACVAAYAFPISLIFWYVLKLTMGIRVKPEEEIEGLDIGEHGNQCYPDFVGTQPESIGAPVMASLRTAEGASLGRPVPVAASSRVEQTTAAH